MATRHPPALLSVRAVEKRFGRTLAVTGVTLDVERREVVGLLGANGSGKTTLLRLVAGLLRPDGGVVEVCGARAGSLAAREHVVLVPDEPAGFDELTVVEHIALLAALYGSGSGAAARAELLLEAFGLADRRHLPVGALSHGLRRRAALTAALSVGAPLVLLDEAAATLDATAVDTLAIALRQHVDGGGAVLLATQDLRFAGAVCDRIATLAEGSIVKAPSPVGLGNCDGTCGPVAVSAMSFAQRLPGSGDARSEPGGGLDAGVHVAAR